MKRLLNTLYVSTQGAYLARDGETVLVRVEKETKLRVPMHNLGGIVCFGVVSCSPPLMQLAAEKQVTISHLTEYGKFQARIVGPVAGNVLLRREQYRRADAVESTAAIVRAVVIGKVANSRQTLLRGARESDDPQSIETLKEAAARLARIVQKLEAENVPDRIRGFEGQAAADYFGVFDALIRHDAPDFRFSKRSRRPPLDPMNALLSFLYTLLVHDCTSACESVGLDPCVGYLHRDRPGRPGLALDLMEELRSWLADRLALTLINRRQLSPKDFITRESGEIRMKDDSRKAVLTAWQKRKQEEISHPFLDEKIAIGLIPHVQALLMARHLRGDLESYPPFLSR